jgi:hypothetical protein
MVGVEVVAQQIPRWVTVAPPDAVTFPPPVALLNETEVIAEVETVGKVILVVKLTSFPYAVPTALVA